MIGDYEAKYRVFIASERAPAVVVRTAIAPSFR
jgi:hypothetical protein